MTADIFALLTRIRVSRTPTDLTKAARSQYLFPLVGAVVGLIAALVALALDTYVGSLEPLAIGAILLVVLYYINGMLHTEGLADFADGLMATGSKEKKTAAMKDVHSGAAAVLTTVLYVVFLFALACQIGGRARESHDIWPLAWAVPYAIGFVIAEAAGKLAMNTSIYLGPSSHAGMGSLFVTEATPTRLVASVFISSAIAFVVSGVLFPLVYLGIAAGIIVTIAARRHFGGVSGDVFGAANELGRIATLLAWVMLV